MKSTITIEEKNLIRRYLLWCYKTTKEELERIDRKFTQLTVDRFVLGELLKHKYYRKKTKRMNYLKSVNTFKIYIASKEKEAYRQKFASSKGTSLNPDYLYLKARLEAIEKSIKHFLGKKALNETQSLYDVQMVKRILEAREHT